MHSILDSIFGSIFGWFWFPTWIPWTQFGTSGLAPNAFFLVFWEIEIGSHFGANLAPFWDPKSIKIHEKIVSKRHPKNDRFLDRFFSSWLHFGTQVGTQEPLKTVPKRSPKTFSNFPSATKTAQEPQEHPGSEFGPFLVPKSDGVPPRASIFEVFSSFKFKFCWPLRVALSIQGCPVHFSSQYAISCKFPSTWHPSTNQSSIHLRA